MFSELTKIKIEEIQKSSNKYLGTFKSITEVPLFKVYTDDLCVGIEEEDAVYRFTAYNNVLELTAFSTSIVDEEENFENRDVFHKATFNNKWIF